MQAPAGAFFVPDDCEVSLCDVRAAVAAARRFRGSDGARQRLVVTSLKVSLPCKMCKKKISLELEEKGILGVVSRLKGNSSGALICKCTSKKCNFQFCVDGNGVVPKLLKNLWHQKKEMHSQTLIEAELTFQHLGIYLTVMCLRVSLVHC